MAAAGRKGTPEVPEAGVPEAMRVQWEGLTAVRGGGEQGGGGGGEEAAAAPAESNHNKDLLAHAKKSDAKAGLDALLQQRGKELEVRAFPCSHSGLLYGGCCPYMVISAL